LCIRLKKVAFLGAFVGTTGATLASDRRQQLIQIIRR
jgi:hypothetical protein